LRGPGRSAVIRHAVHVPISMSYMEDQFVLHSPKEVLS
jgi:hypothetical protein